ncbi:cullin 3, partial [Reticulomyxa filosa]
DPEKFVTEVLALRENFQEIVDVSFRRDKHFQRSMKEAFEYFINLDTKSAQYLSLYTDILLRKNSLKMQDTEVMQKLDDVIVIFKFLRDKDMFEDYYKKHLAHRLLHGQGSSEFHEKAMIGKLKVFLITIKYTL